MIHLLFASDLGRQPLQQLAGYAGTSFADAAIGSKVLVIGGPLGKGEI